MHSPDSPYSPLLFVDRSSYQDCHRHWCVRLPERDCVEHMDWGQIIDWHGQRYWGERQMVVQWYDEEKKPICSSIIDESKLWPCPPGVTLSQARTMVLSLH